MSNATMSSSQNNSLQESTKFKLTRYGYIVDKSDIDKKKLEKIRLDLTVTPFKMGGYAKLAKDSSFKVYEESHNRIKIPRFYGINTLGKPSVNRLDLKLSNKTKSFNMKYLGQLRPKQETIVANVLEGLDKHGGGILIAGCGIGKTNMALYIACKLNVPTLFIAHKNFLINQAKDRALTTTNIKSFGIIQGKKVDIKGKNLVFGMIQTLCKKTYDDDIFKKFGLIIIDEVHHMGAKNFSNFFKLVSAPRMLGISADNRRKDQMYKIINWYMGPFLHTEPEKYNDKVIVKQFLFTTNDEKNTKVIVNKYIGESDRSTMITNLVAIKTKNDFGINIIKLLYEQGKNILVLTSRLTHVDIIYDRFANEQCVGKYIGGMTDVALKSSSVKQIIVATFEMAQEGLDIDNLNVVILFSPKSDVKQAIGRILRKDEYEYNPIVIDIVDQSNEVFAKQAKTRTRYYAERKFNVQRFHVADHTLAKHFMYNDLAQISAALSKPIESKNVNNAIQMEKIIKPLSEKYAELDFIDSDNE